MDIAPETDASSELRAIELKEEAQDLRARGYLEQALPLAQESVRLRWGSRLICLSLDELGGIYLEMLKLDEAEETARHMLREAHRYDTQAQKRLAHLLMEDAKEERRHGFQYGNTVTLQGLHKVEMNGRLGEIRGRALPQTAESTDRYRVLVGSSILSFRKENISLIKVVVQLDLEAQTDGGVTATGRTMQGNTCARIRLERVDLQATDVRREVAKSMGQTPSAIQLALPDGSCVRDGVAGDDMLQRYADSIVDNGAEHATPDRVHQHEEVLKSQAVSECGALLAERRSNEL